jgi:co-chaperonin GroES (HSP10)
MNTSGFLPVEYKIIIRPEKIEETDDVLKAARAAGIALLDDSKDRERMAQIKGTLIAVGGNAFEDWRGVIPKAGDMIYFAKYAGINITGADGAEYRLCNDKDITAIVTA